MVNSLYILNKDKRIVDTLSNNGDNPKSPFFEDKYTQHLATGAETLEFTTFSNERTSKYCEVGSYVAFKLDRKVKMFQIVETQEEHSEGQIVKTCYCEVAGLELINNIVRPMEMASTNVEQLFKTVLEGTPWAIGLIEWGINDTVHTIKIEKPTNVYSAIQDNLQKFNVEIEFRVEMAGPRVVGQYIDIQRRRGKETRKRFEYGINVSGVSKQIDISNLCTAMVGTGKGGIDFKEAEWLSDKPALKPKNQDFIVNPAAYERWNRQGEQLVGVYENTEVENPYELLELTWKALVDASVPQFTYDVATEMIKGDEENINIGDTVYVIDNDYEPALHLSARVGQLELSFTDHTKNKCVLTNFKDVKSGILSLETIQAIIDGRFPIGNNDIQDGAVSGDKIENETITGVLIKADAIEAKHITSDSIDTKHLKAGSITADKAIIAEAAIKTANIGDAQITSAKIANGAIDNAHIEDATINGAKIKDASIGTAQIGDAAITNAKIGNLAVDNAKIKDLSADKITSGEISTEILKANVIEAVNASIGKITADHIDVESLVVDNIDAGKITTGTLDADRIAASVITAVNASIETAKINQAKIGDLDASKITTGELSADRIKTNVINAINASIGSATIDSAKIGNLDASKITTGTLNADRIGAGSITANKINADAISAISVNASEVVAGKITAGEIKITDANIIDGTINGAKIAKATISNAQINQAFIADAYIKSLDAGKISTGTLDTTKVGVSSTSGNLTIANNTIQIKDNQTTPKVRVQVGQDQRGQYGILVFNAKGEAIFDSDKGVLSTNGLNDGVVSNDKIVDGTIQSNKLMVDEIWASEGFIANFQAQEINADKITTGQISGERIDINGMVSFGSLNTDLKGSFTQNSGKTFIDGGNILTQTLTGEQINTRGFKSSDSAGNTTFNIDKDSGKVSMSGLVESIGYSDVEGQYKGYQLDPTGKATLNDAILRGSVILPQAGITNADNTGDRKVRFWAGADYEARETAPFIVYSDGKIKATEGEFGGTFTGKLSIGNIHIEDTNNSKGAIEIKTANDAETRIHLSEDTSFINSNLSVGSNFLNMDTTNSILGIKGKVEMSNGNFSSYLNVGSNISVASNGEVSHKQRYSQNRYIFEAEGDNKGDYDYRFYRDDAPVRVDVFNGELNVGNKITMNNNIAIVARQDVGNSGFDYVVK